MEWKDGSVDWVPLKDLKQSNQLDLAEYVMANDISDEPAFNWWVKETLQHIDRIISKVKSNYFSTSHKFRIQVPKTLKEAYDIDIQSGTDFWTKTIAKEMTNICIAFENLDRVKGLFQIHMRISFPFLHAKDLRRILLITRNRSF